MKIPKSIKVQGALKSFIIKNNVWYFDDLVELAMKEENDFIFEMSSRYPTYCLFLINDRKRKIFNSKKLKKENKSANQSE